MKIESSTDRSERDVRGFRSEGVVSQSRPSSRILASIHFWRVSCRDSHQAEPEVYGDYLFDSSTFAEISAIYSIVSKITRFSSIGDFFNFKYTNIVF